MKTSLYTILCIVVRLGAVLLFVQTLVGLPFAWESMQASQFGPGASRMLIAFGGLTLVLAFCLWLYPGLLARLAAGNAARQPFESRLDVDDWQTIAFAVLGVGFAMAAVLDLAGVVLRFVLAALLDDTRAYAAMRADAVRIVTYLLKLILGLLLALRARGLVGLLAAMRARGPRQSDESAPVERPQ